jgi:peptidoglycan pentaglycine glycine transferase (the first glycine)
MKLITNLEEKEYRKFTENNNAHFLQSYEWGQVSKKRGLIPYYLGLEDNGCIVATALLLKKNMPLNYSYFYIPRGYTINYDNLELIKIFTNEIVKFCKSEKAIFFRLDPDIKLHTIDSNALKISGEDNYKLVNYLKQIGFKHKKLTKYFETMQPRYTFRIDLKDDIDTIESRYTTTTNQRIKKAIKCGVHVEVGTKDDIKEFVRLMKMTEKRQGFYSHDLDFYEYFYDLFSKNNMVTLYLGKVNIKEINEKLNSELKTLEEEYKSLIELTNKKANNRKKELDKNIKSIKEQLEFYKDKPKKDITVSSYLTVHYGNKSWALYAANDMDYKRMFANYLVYQRQIKDAKELGNDIFDVFGTIGDPNSDSHLIGLHDFKKKWGGEYTEFIGEFDYILKPGMNFIYNKIIPLRHKIINKKLRKNGK